MSPLTIHATVGAVGARRLAEVVAFRSEHEAVVAGFGANGALAYPKKQPGRREAVGAVLR